MQHSTQALAGEIQLEENLKTTSGVIALLNMQSQMDVLQKRISAGISLVSEQVGMCELISLRGLLLGHIADYQWAEKEAGRLVLEFPKEGLSFIARARARATFHRFTEALSDLDSAEVLGADRETTETERAGIFQALGHYDRALVFFMDSLRRKPGFNAFSSLAVLHAEMEETSSAEEFFSEARKNFRGVSPIPLALLDFRQGLMWMGQEDFSRSRFWFGESIRRLPDYAQAQGHLAEVEAELGEFDMAVRRLVPLTISSDDPDYPAALDRILRAAGREAEAGPWQSRAAIRYNELMSLYPEAFADHAAEFWLEAGDPQRALEFARMNLQNRQTPRAKSLADRASIACKKTNHTP